MELRVMTPAELAAAYAEDFCTAFPAAERKPLAVMEQLRSREVYEPLGLFDGPRRLGSVLLWRDEEGFRLMDYLVVSAACRNSGLGETMIRLCRARYPDCPAIFGETEAPVASTEAENILIRRRLAFYLRCGTELLTYETALFGVRYRTICWREPSVSEAEIQRHHRALYQGQFPPAVYRAAVQIPLDPSEAPYPQTDWNEV